MSRHLETFRSLVDEVEKEVLERCRYTNQWFLLKEMLESRSCHPLLLPESPSEAWVEEVVQHRLLASGSEGFRAQEFQCQLVWKHHITLHQRLKTMKSEGATPVFPFALTSVCTPMGQSH